MTNQIQIGDTLDLHNTKGEVIVRLVYVGDGMAKQQRPYGAAAEWRDSAPAKAMNQEQIDFWLSKK